MYENTKSENTRKVNSVNRKVCIMAMTCGNGTNIVCQTHLLRQTDI